MLSRQQFEWVRQLALELAGIELVERHHALIARRAQRLEISDAPGLEALLRDVEAGEPAAARRFVQLVTTKFTGFFRNPEQFRIAAAHAVRAVRERGRVRLWCAGAATGEEAYSLAIVLLEALGRDDPPAEIVATDLDAEALARAERGEYALESLEPAPLHLRERYFSAGAPGRVTAGCSVRQLVQFRPLNLASPDWSVRGPFDVVFCRNVLMYIASPRRQSIVERISGMLSHGGLLIVDPVEWLANTTLTPLAGGVHANLPPLGAQTSAIARAVP